MIAYKIAGRDIGSEHPPYVIAELSANYNGRIESAVRIIDKARRANVDAVKLQTYRAETIALGAGNNEFRIQSALEAHAGEMRLFPHARSLDAVGHLVRWRGATARMVAPEGFQLARTFI